MKLSLQTQKHPNGDVFVDLDPLTETPKTPAWIETLADVVGLLVLGAVGLLAMIVL